MNTWKLMVSVLLLAYTSSAQQIDVRLELTHSVFILGEPIVANVTVANNSRIPIIIGENAPDKILIEITRESQYDELEPQNNAPLFAASQIGPGQTVQQSFELDKWFALYDSGKYMIRAIVVKEGVRHETRRKTFDVVPGVPLKEGIQMFVDKQSLSRKFHLVYWMRNQVNRLFLRIEDSPTGQAWDTIDLGVLSKVTEPKLDISPKGEVTVIHRSTQDAFIRTVIWSLPMNIEIAERDALVDPDVSSTQRVRSLYEEMQKEEKKVASPWWKFW
ncbi:MAG: hypothetical protein WCP12_05920 [bacterium]